MIFIKKLLDKGPSKKWGKKLLNELTFDFNDYALNGIKIRSDIQELSFLGFAENTYDDYLEYNSNGLIIYFDHNKIRGYVLEYGSSFNKKFSGKIKINNDFISIDDLNSVDAIKHYFGTPVEEFSDNNYSSLSYLKNGNVDILVTFFDGKLESIDISIEEDVDEKPSELQNEINKVIKKADKLISSEVISGIKLPYHVFYAKNIFKTVFLVLLCSLFLIPLFIPFQFERREFVQFFMIKIFLPSIGGIPMLIYIYLAFKKTPLFTITENKIVFYSIWGKKEILLREISDVGTKTIKSVTYLTYSTYKKTIRNKKSFMSVIAREVGSEDNLLCSTSAINNYSSVISTLKQLIKKNYDREYIKELESKIPNTNKSKFWSSLTCRRIRLIVITFFSGVISGAFAGFLFFASFLGYGYSILAFSFIYKYLKRNFEKYEINLNLLLIVSISLMIIVFMTSNIIKIFIIKKSNMLISLTTFNYIEIVLFVITLAILIISSKVLTRKASNK